MRVFSVKLNHILLTFFAGICILLLIFALVPRLVRTSKSADAEEFIPVPIIMYHSVTTQQSRSGNYAVTTEVLENDMKYLNEQGYTSIFMKDLIDYVYNGTPLPEKPIIVTLDDGFYNNMTYALPIFEKYHVKSVISIVGSYTDTYSESNEMYPAYSYLRWCDIRQIMDNGMVEFQNHTYDLHSMKGSRSASSRRKGESEDQYKSVFTGDILKLQKLFQEKTGYTPNTFTYPFGKIDKLSLDYVKEMGFQASLSCYEGVNHITRDPECLYQLKRNNRIQKMGTAEYFNKKLTEH